MHILFLSAEKEKERRHEKVTKSHSIAIRYTYSQIKRKSIVTKSQRPDSNVYKQNVVSEMKHLIGELITN